MVGSAEADYQCLLHSFACCCSAVSSSFVCTLQRDVRSASRCVRCALGELNTSTRAAETRHATPSLTCQGARNLLTPSCFHYCHHLESLVERYLVVCPIHAYCKVYGVTCDSAPSSCFFHATRSDCMGSVARASTCSERENRVDEAARRTSDEDVIKSLSSLDQVWLCEWPPTQG